MARQRPESELASPIPAGIIVTLVRHHFRNRFSDTPVSLVVQSSSIKQAIISYRWASLMGPRATNGSCSEAEWYLVTSNSSTSSHANGSLIYLPDQPQGVRSMYFSRPRGDLLNGGQDQLPVGRYNLQLSTHRRFLCRQSPLCIAVLVMLSFRTILFSAGRYAGGTIAPSAGGLVGDRRPSSCLCFCPGCLARGWAGPWHLLYYIRMS